MVFPRISHARRAGHAIDLETLLFEGLPLLCWVASVIISTYLSIFLTAFRGFDLQAAAPTQARLLRMWCYPVIQAVVLLLLSGYPRMGLRRRSRKPDAERPIFPLARLIPPFWRRVLKGGVILLITIWQVWAELAPLWTAP